MTYLAAIERLGEVAAGQCGRVHTTQAGLTAGRVQTFIRNHILRPTHLPRVYAVGYPRDDPEARLWEAVLYAGPGAYLTGASAAHHLGLIADAPEEITVATPRKVLSRDGITVLRRRPARHGLAPRSDLPIAFEPEVLLQLAADGATLTTVRLALSNLDFNGTLDPAALRAVCGRGRVGTKRLLEALDRHLPELARCRSVLEIDFLVLVDDHHLRLPVMNRWVNHTLVDAYWPELKLVVELDGGANHSTAAQQRRDRGSTERLRAAGLTVIRLSWEDVHAGASGTLARLHRAGVERAPRPS